MSKPGYIVAEVSIELTGLHAQVELVIVILATEGRVSDRHRPRHGPVTEQSPSFTIGIHDQPGFARTLRYQRTDRVGWSWNKIRGRCRNRITTAKKRHLGPSRVQLWRLVRLDRQGSNGART